MNYLSDLLHLKKAKDSLENTINALRQELVSIKAQLELSYERNDKLSYALEDAESRLLTSNAELKHVAARLSELRTAAQRYLEVSAKNPCPVYELTTASRELQSALQ